MVIRTCSSDTCRPLTGDLFVCSRLPRRIGLQAVLCVWRGLLLVDVCAGPCVSAPAFARLSVFVCALVCAGLVRGCLRARPCRCCVCVCVWYTHPALLA